MVFTVIQYMPILEEETPSHRLELAKKLNQNDPSGDGDTDTGDDDNDPDVKSDINYYPVSNFIYVHNYKHAFPAKNGSWPNQVETINTPPPQI